LYVLSLPLQVFFEAESVVAEPEAVFVAAEPEVFALVFATAELSPEVLASVAEPGVAAVVAEPEAVFVAAEPEVFALAFAAAELSPEVLASVAGPGVVFVAVVSVAEPQASVDIAVAFVVLVLVSLAVVELDSSGCPRFPVFPNVDHFASSSSSVEVGC
jgi:hypothetical protein